MIVCRQGKQSFIPKQPQESFVKVISLRSQRELATCTFIREKETVIIIDPSGVGKSHLAQALSACRSYG